jgi:hypothetical protein
MIPILLYSHVNEPLTRSLLSSKLDQTHGLIKLSLEALLDQVNILDELNEYEVKIDWTFPSGEKISNSSSFYLINRVLSVPEKLFQDFAEQDRLYSLSEFKAYLAFAIEAFPNAFSRSGAFGLSGNRYSLPRQWEMIRNAKFSLKTPEYYLGNMDFCPLNGELIYANTFDYYFWKPNRSLVDLEKVAFAFLKPQGKPLVACVVREDVQVFSCNSADNISTIIHSLVSEKALELSHLFNYPIAEILFFAEDQSICFGMVSNIPYASSKKNWFQEKVASYFVEEISGKYGKN